VTIGDAALLAAATDRRRIQRRFVLAGVAVVVAGTVTAAVIWWSVEGRARAEREAAQSLATDLATAFEARNLAGIPGDRDAMATDFETAVEALATAEVAVDAEPVTVDDAGATTRLAVSWTLPDGDSWEYRSSVAFARTGEESPRWRVQWSPSLIHPDLRAGERLVVDRVTPERGNIIGRDGTAIVEPRPVVEVSVDVAAVTDPDRLGASLAELTGIDGAALTGRVRSAPPGTRLPVVTLRESDWAPVADAVTAVPGVVTEPGERALAPTREFARAFLGSVGEVTAEQVAAAPDTYQAGDVAGRSGLQEALDGTLRGEPGLVVSAAPAPRDGESASDAEPGDDPKVLYESAPERGRDVTVTLDPRVQQAADSALSDVGTPSAIVVVDVPTGDVLAVANGPAAGFDVATTGQYPPGSVFKVVTAAGLLAGGLTPDTTVACPRTATVDGRDFGNARDAKLGDVPFREAFAQSCNTAFVTLAGDLAPGDLGRTASDSFGIGRRGDLGTGAFPGEVPQEETATEIAAASIGQGQVLVSPLIAADIAATVARGSWLEPRILMSGDGDDRARGEPLAADQTLRDLMREVVTTGSGTAVAAVPGGPVHGKTGTAEYDREGVSGTHAWFIGYQGDLAFAVLVADTADAFGGDTAAPVAAELLTALAGNPAGGL
jgi:cell division protein FtsI/penicillin-binding protein 2